MKKKNISQYEDNSMCRSSTASLDKDNYKQHISVPTRLPYTCGYTISAHPH